MEKNTIYQSVGLAMLAIPFLVLTVWALFNIPEARAFFGLAAYIAVCLILISRGNK